MLLRDEIGESLTLKFAEAARKRREQNLPIYSLGLGEPDFDTPPEIVEAVYSVLKRGNSRYSSPMGSAKLREKIAQKLSSENGINATSSSIFVGAGAKQVLSIILMALLKPTDEVVVLSPSFVSFVPQVYLAEPNCVVNIIEIDPKTHTIDLEKLAEVVNAKTKAIILNSPNNPAGFILNKAELQQVLDLAKQTNTYVISDEVYEKLVFGDHPHVSIGALEHNIENVITINGFSKSHAMTGWRVGYAAMPAFLQQDVLKIQQHINTNTCTFVQQALEIAWDPACPHLHSYLEILSRRADIVARWIESVDALECNVPSAGFFAFVSIQSLGMSSNDFCAKLLAETGVATTPGIAFGRQWDNHFRLSFALEDRQLVDALSLIKKFVESL